MDLAPVSQTALITLRARADEQRRPRPLFADPWALTWYQKLAWPAHLTPYYNSFVQAKTCIRAYHFDHLVLALAQERPTTVVELGCGFSTRAQRLARPYLDWRLLDLPEVGAWRQAWGGPDPQFIGSSVLAPHWSAHLGAHRVILVAEGLWYYLAKEQVTALMGTLAQNLPGAYLISDLVGRRDLAASAIWSQKLGAPISWAVDDWQALEKTWHLQPVPPWSHDRLVHDSITLYAHRYGPLYGATLRFLARWPGLANQASRLIVGQLTP